MTTLEALKAARTRITENSNWVQRDFAQDSAGRAVMSDSPNACKWCAVGAIRSVAGYGNYAEDAISSSIGIDVVEFNDNHTHAEVLAAFDESIAKLEAV